MPVNDAPIVKDLVLVGGGHAHLAVLKAFGEKPLAGVRLTLIARELETPYARMLPGLIAGHYTVAEAHINLRRLARFAGARLYHAAATGLDLAERRVVCAGRPPVPFDVLSLDIGCEAGLEAVPGAAENAIPVKPVGSLLARWSALEAQLLRAEGTVRIGVVGGGCGGVELLLAIHHRMVALLTRAGRSEPRLDFHLVTASDSILPEENHRAQDLLMDALEERGVAIHVERQISAIEPGRLLFMDGGDLELDAILWAAGGAAPDWLGDTGLDLDADGFVAVQPTLETLGYAGVFAAGDVASVRGFPRPKAVAVAERQGAPLVENLRRALAGQPREPFQPRRRHAAFVATGGQDAVAIRGDRAIRGRWVWRWKDWRDRRWIAALQELEPSPPPALPAAADGVGDEKAQRELGALRWRGGDSAAKLNRPALRAALAGIRQVERPDVPAGLPRHDDGAVLEVPPDQLLVQSVDQLGAFIEDPYLLGRIAANHALNDLFAMGAAPQSAMVIVTLPYGTEEQGTELLSQLMAGVNDIFTTEGVAIAGGHTALGPALTLGFSVNGLAAPGFVLHKSNLQPDDILILTKPLGTGVLLAADLRGKAPARWMEAALAAMLGSNREATGLLLQHGARAATNVSGFGLLAHLLEMLESSGLEAAIDLDAIPALPGALDCLAAGIVSTLHTANQRERRAIRNIEAASDPHRLGLLFDPQTAGGLLAGVPRSAARACLAALHAQGYAEAAILGVVRPTVDPLQPVLLDPGLLKDGTLV